MFRVSVSKEFICQHFLIGGDWGKENMKHSHHFKVEIQLKGENLNTHGYLYDISILQEQLDLTIARYEDKTLNDLPEFENLNPSVEYFSQFFLQNFCKNLELDHLTEISCKLWEDKSAWASYSRLL